MTFKLAKNLLLIQNQKLLLILAFGLFVFPINNQQPSNNFFNQLSP